MFIVRTADFKIFFFDIFGKESYMFSFLEQACLVRKKIILLGKMVSG